MKKALLIVLTLSLAVPFNLNATSDKDVDMENIDVSEVTEEQSISSSSEEELETRVRVTQNPAPTKTKSKPAWKRWLGYGFITLISIGCGSDALNFGYGFTETKTTIALPYRDSLPDNGARCEYSYSPNCNGVINEELCNEYLDQSSENKIILGECVVDERDEAQLSLGAISWFTRFATSYFVFQGIDKIFLKNN